MKSARITKAKLTMVLAVVISLLLGAALCTAQDGKLSDSEVAEAKGIIQKMKQSPKGPYQSIHWFAEDGSVHAAREKPSKDRGKAYQHAAFSADSKRLKQLGFSVGIILAGLSYDEFFDANNLSNPHDTVKQYIVTKFLYEADDGWVLRRAKSYRGAVQIEDEELFGRQFLSKMLQDQKWVQKNFWLAREAVRSVPHRRSEGDATRTIRQLSKEISDQEPSFQNIRVKIHSWPGEDDIKSVRLYIEKNPQLDSGLQKKLDLLLEALKSLYGEVASLKNIELFAQRLKSTPHEEKLRKLRSLLSANDASDRLGVLCDYLSQIRSEIETSSDGNRNLLLMDLSLYLEALTLFQPEAKNASATLKNAPLLRYRKLVAGAYGAGFLSERERGSLWSELDLALSIKEVAPAAYKDLSDYLRRVVEWSYGTATYHFGILVDRYALIEPLSIDFIPNLTRSSIMLPLSETVDKIASDSAAAIGLINHIFGQKQKGTVRALNPGLAFGILEILDESDIGRANFMKNRIYLLPKTVTDLKPVAGILTLDSGSPLSHVQILARNLGIPNGVVSSDLLPLIRRYQKQEVFYAISPKGVVVLKDKGKLDQSELSLIQAKSQLPDIQIKVNLKKLKLQERRILTLSSISAKDSGVIVGPKAANVAELYHRFPDQVAPGLVLPFGIFLQHLNQKAPTDAYSPFQKMVEAYRQADQMTKLGKSEDEVNGYLLGGLSEFRKSILNVILISSFKEDLRSKMEATFGKEGSYGVFIRSDTNVEDLEGFTGAGLNLTVPNQIQFEAVLNAIRQVWASPFSERSYAWRQRFLDQPEHVYPSVLIMKSVPNDKSGVLVTRNLESDDRESISVAVHEGVGGVVDGEAAESLLLKADGSVKLLAAAKTPHRRKLRMQPPGGAERLPVSGETKILTDSDIEQVRKLVDKIRREYPNTKSQNGTSTVWDVEFGFLNGKLMLFQIRPLAESQKAMNLAYLRSLDKEMKR